MKVFSDLNVLGYAWHEPHQYELAKLGFKYFLEMHVPEISGHGNWNVSKRPLPKKSIEMFRPPYEIMDLAVLHVDEQCVETHLPVVGSSWKGMFRKLRSVCADYEIPKIVINHGVPMNLRNREEMQEELESCDVVVVNSEQALKEWGLKRSVHVTHGMSPEEFVLGSASNGKVLCSVRESVINAKPWYYGKEFYDFVKNQLRVDVFETRCSSFEEYVKKLGSYSVLFNPTTASPMPRFRTEALMCGVPVVSTPNHDWNKYVKDGKNGFLFKTGEEAVEKIKWCLENPGLAREIGVKGREAAIRHFHIDRYLGDWKKIIRNVLE